MNFKIAFALGACLAVFPNIKAPDYCPDPTNYILLGSGVLGAALILESSPVKKIGAFLDENPAIPVSAMTAALFALFVHIYKQDKELFNATNEKITQFLAQKNKLSLLTSNQFDAIYNLIKQSNEAQIKEHLDLWLRYKKAGYYLRGGSLLQAK